jgi:hypothetical protein
MDKIFTEDHLNTHKTIFEFLKGGRGYDIYRDSPYEFGWGIGMKTLASFIPYQGYDDGQRDNTEFDFEQKAYLDMVKRAEK